MLRLHPLEERIVLDAALLIELEDERRGAQEGESGSVPDPDAVDEPGEASWSEAGEDRSMPVMAALQLLDSASLHPVAESLPAPLLYREGDGDQRVLEPEQLPVLEADQGHATWATVTLEGASVGDELVAPDSDADFDIRSEGAHEVTITASASLLADNTPAEVEELLRNKVALINYTNSAPDPLEGVRSLHFTLGNDMHQASLLRFVSVTSANDAPILTAGGPTELDFTEPADPGERVPLSLFGPGTVSITDVDSALVGGASVWISDAPASASDPLGSLDRLLVELPADGSITARLSFTPVADRSLGELRLTLEGAASAETYARVLESVRFDSLDTDPLQTSRTLRVNVSDIDDDGAREDAVSRSIERRIAIEPTNTAPTVILENVLFSEQSDRLANVPLFPRLELLDPDSDDLLTRVVVTLDNAGRHTGDSINAYLSGNALFSVTRVTDGARDTYTIQPRAPGSTATVGQFEAFLSSWTYGNSSRANVDHSIDITVRAFDAQGAVGEESSTLTIAAHPDAPTSEALPHPGSPGALTVVEDGRLSLPAELFPFRDADGDELGGVTITTLPAHGSLLIDGVAVQAGQLIPAAALANLVYAPAPDYHGPDGFGFKVWDDSGADGGPGLASAQQQASITVTPVNDTPVSSDDRVLTLEDTPVVLGVDDFGRYRDVDGDALAAVRITTLPADGTLQYNAAAAGAPANWVAVQRDQQLGVAELAAGKLRFVPGADEHGAAYASIGFRVSDGTAFSARAYTLTVEVTPVDDTPTSGAVPGSGDEDALTVPEDGRLPLPASVFPFADADGDELGGVTITTLPAHGSLLIDGVAVQAGQLIPAAALANLVYAPAPDYHGPDGFGFKVWDDSGADGGPGLASAQQQAAITVTPVNDAPVSSNDRVVTLEDTPIVLGVDDFGRYRDVDGDALAAVRITTLPTDGTLQYNAAAAGAPANWVAVQRDQQLGVAELAAGKLRFVPGADEHGAAYASIGFRVSDGTAFSARAYTLTVEVTPVDDTPTSGAVPGSGDEDALTVPEDGRLPLPASVFPFADADGDELGGVTITTLPAHGSLLLDGVAVQAGQLIPAAALANLVYAPAPDYHGPDGFGFKVWDDSGADGGPGLASAQQQASITVTPVNDAPVSSNDRVLTLEDTPVVLGVDDFGRYRDVDGDALAAVRITTLPADGTLQYNAAAAGAPANWVAVQRDQQLGVAELAAGKLRFVPGADEHGAAYASIGFRVSDGTAFSARAYTLTVEVTPVDDPDPGFAGFNSPEDDQARVEPELSITPALAYTAPFGYASIDYEVLLKRYTYPETDSGEPERLLAVSEAFETCTLHPLLGIGCRFVPAVTEGSYLLESGRGGLTYATPEASGVPPEALTRDGLLADAPGQPPAGFNTAFADAFPHTLADSEFVGVEPGQVELPPGGVLIPAYPEPMRPSPGAGER